MSLFRHTPVQPPPPPPNASKSDAERVENAKRLAGSINFALGPAGCGKTHTALRVSLAAAYYCAKPWYGYDSNGDVMRHMRGIQRAYRTEYERQKQLANARDDATYWSLRDRFEAEDATAHQPKLSVSELRRTRAENAGLTLAQAEAKRAVERAVPLAQRRDLARTLLAKAWARLDFIKACLDHFYKGPLSLPKLLAHVRGSIRDGLREASEESEEAQRKVGPRYILFIDEAGAVRHEDEDFWPEMRQARNAGVTLYTTGHRTKDLHPAALANLRTAMLWKPTAFKSYELGAMTVPGSQCAESKSGKIHFVVLDDPRPKVFRMGESLYPTYPPELIVPAQPTVGVASGF